MESKTNKNNISTINVENIKNTVERGLVLEEIKEEVEDKIERVPGSLVDVQLMKLYDSENSEVEELENGELRNVQIYNTPRGELKIISPNEELTEAQFIIVKKLFSYANKQGMRPGTKDAGRFSFEFNKFMQYLKVTPHKNGGYRKRDKQTVWQALLAGKETRYRFQYNMRLVAYKQKKREPKTISRVFDESLLTVVADFDNEGGTFQLKNLSKEVPERLTVTFATELVYQLTGGSAPDGFKRVQYYTNEPRLPIKELTRGSYRTKEMQALIAFINKEYSTYTPPNSTIRNFEKKELLEIVAGKLGSKKRGEKKESSYTYRDIDKLRSYLEIIRKNNHLGNWGCRDHIDSKKLSKENLKNAPWVWLDFSGTCVDTELRNSRKVFTVSAGRKKQEKEYKKIAREEAKKVAREETKKHLDKF